MTFDQEFIEKYVVGCMMQDKECAYRHIEITTKHFTNEAVRNIYEDISQTMAKGKTVDIVDLLVSRKCDSDTINQCHTVAVTTAGFDTQLEKLKTLHVQRTLSVKASQLINVLREEDFDNVSDVIGVLGEYYKVNNEEAFTSEHISDTVTELYQEYQDSDSIMRYGIEDLDKYTQGIFKKELTVIAARPGQGKTALALQITLNLAMAGVKSLFVSREMGSTQILRRIFSNLCNINSNRLKRKEYLNREDRQKMKDLEDIVKSLPIRTNTRADTVECLINEARYLHSRGELDILVIDYLQLLTTKERFQSREQEIAYISRQLKLLTLELEIPILLLSQLNRAVEQRQIKRPMLSDLRESGAIEQDANNVFMLYQDEELESEQKIEICITKQREGVLVNVPIRYYKPIHTMKEC